MAMRFFDRHAEARARARIRRRENSTLPDRTAWSGLRAYRDWDNVLIINGHPARPRGMA